MHKLCEKYLNWFILSAGFNMNHMNTLQVVTEYMIESVVSKMRLLVDFNPLNYLLSLYQGGSHHLSSPFFIEDILSLVLSLFLHLPLSSILSDGAL